MSVISLAEWRKKQAALSELKSPSPANIPWEELGLKHTDVDDYMQNLVSLYIVLDRAWRNPFTVKSDFAREGALHVAIAASEGFISTKIDTESWGRRWLISEVGMEVKAEIDDVLQEILQSPHTIN
jgi:hypothetical protein